MLKARGISMGLATVYRQLENLVDEGEVDAIISPTGENCFAIVEAMKVTITTSSAKFVVHLDLLKSKKSKRWQKLQQSVIDFQMSLTA